MQDIIYEPSANDPEDKKHSLSIKLKAIYSLIKNRWSRRRALSLIALISATILTLQLLGISLNNFYNYIEPLTTKIDQLSDNANWITWVALLALVSYLTYLLKPLGKRCIGYFRECYVEYEKLVKSFVINPTEEKPIGFVTDTPEEEKLDIGWRDYCSTIVSTLEATDLSKDCFAIGISGGWGSGKTTFLKELQAQLKENPSYMLIEYNPWNTGNKSDIVENFFKTFSSLVGHRSSLYPHLQRYARALSDVGGVKWEALTNIFIPEKTLDELKEQINQSVLNSRKRYVFFIDDLDRLDKEEIFEVLKLIRASANFKNTIFIVAYDPDYIENMLGELGVTEPLIYLQKIFNLELSLPSFERDTIPKLLSKELKKLCNFTHWEEIESVTHSPSKSNGYLIPRLIKNLRDVKRFINLFTASYIQTTEKLGRNFSFSDLFWIEVLHYVSPKVYGSLRDDPYTYLDIPGSHNSYVPWRFVFQTNKKRELTEQEQEILSLVFPQNNSEKGGFGIHLRYEANYYGYFALRPLHGQLLYSEIKGFLSRTHSLEEVRNQLSRWRDGDYTNSLIYHLRTYGLTDSENEQLNFVRLCISCITKDMHEALDILANHLARGQTAEHPAPQQLFELLREYITIHWSSKIAALFIRAIHRKPINGSLAPLINIEQIANLAPLVLERILEEQDSPRASSILMNNSPLNSFLKMMTYKVNIDDRVQEDNLVIAELRDYYIVRKEECTFEEFISPLYKHPLPENPLPEYLLRLQYSSTQIQEVFGNSDNFKQFSEACFDLDKETLQKHYKELGID